MSNRASLRRTMFTGDGDDTGWGWRICDDYFRSYADDCNEQDVPKDPLQLLSKACAEATEQERLVFEDLLAAVTAGRPARRSLGRNGFAVIRGGLLRFEPEQSGRGLR